MACATHFVRVPEKGFELDSYTSGDSSRICWLDPECLSQDDRESRKRSRSLEDSGDHESVASDGYHNSDFERELEALMNPHT